MNDIRISDDHAYLFRDGVWEERERERKSTQRSDRKKKRKDATMTTSNIFLSLSFFALIRRKSFTDEMIICLFSCAVTAGLLIVDGKTERTRRRRRRRRKKGCDARTGARTLDIVVKSHTLYRLSYPGHAITRTNFVDALDFSSVNDGKSKRLSSYVHIVI